VNWARTNRVLPAVEGRHWLAYLGQGPVEAIHRVRLEQDQLQRPELGRQICQSKGPVRCVYVEK
jgi:hypothetical protein